jgi:histidinol dehydrogenase
MESFIYPSQNQWNKLVQRAGVETHPDVVASVASIIADVYKNGDAAIRSYEERFTGAKLDSIEVSEKEIDEASQLVDEPLRKALAQALENIKKFHAAQSKINWNDVTVETVPGVVCSQRVVPIEKVGLYIPGGNAPLFSTVLMLAVPAKLAGCKTIIMCTPARPDGTVNPAILYAAKIAGVDRIFKVGGAQAIAAMAHGTETIPAVHKIFGPGNRFVMEAKQQVAKGHVAIDMPAGPSEVLIIADETANLDFVAADFLSQAEHGPDSQSILLTSSQKVIDKLPSRIDKLLSELPHQEMINKSLHHSRLILLHDDDEIMDFSNTYAPEHLIINTANASQLAKRVVNAGSVFIGALSPESAGDYASGTNHTLPTSGYATAYSGVNIDSFVKKITFQELSTQGVATIGNTVETMAYHEDLHAHKLAMTIRLKSIPK